MSESLDRARAAAGRLKVFPLPSVVLLPGSAMPLHIFEQRYRDMVKDAMEGDRLFAMAQMVPGQEQGQPRPELEPVVCVGSIAVHQQLDDGRSNLVLVGVTRARIVRELPQTKQYREIEVDVLPDADVPLGDPDEVALRQALVELVARLPIEVGERIGQVTGRVHGGALADVLASAIMDDVVRRYEVLCETDVRERMRVVTEETMMLVGTMKLHKPEGLLN